MDSYVRRDGTVFRAWCIGAAALLIVIGSRLKVNQYASSLVDKHASEAALAAQSQRSTGIDSWKLQHALARVRQ